MCDAIRLCHNQMYFIFGTGNWHDVYNDEQSPKDLPPDNNSSVGNKELSADHKGLMPIEVESPNPPSIQHSDDEEDQKVGARAHYSQNVSVLCSYISPLLSFSASCKGSKRIYLGDSWFGSAKASEVVALTGSHTILVIKMNHSRSAKMLLEKKMGDYPPGGTGIVLVGQVEKYEDLVCLGYK